jgi:phosphatidylserine decarboxylase
LLKYIGATFRVDEFLGFNLSTCNLIKSSSFNDVSHEAQEPQLLNDKQNVMKQKRFAYVVIYLAPHNYHHFHSPCEFGVITRRHMQGTVFPVFKGLARRLNVCFTFFKVSL